MNPTTDQKIEALQVQMDDRMQALAEENLRLKRSARRYVRWSTILVAVACVGGLSYAWAIDPLTDTGATAPSAAGEVKTEFADAAVISAGEFSSNFENLVAKTNELVASSNVVESGGKRVVGVGVVCGESGSTTGNIGGHAGAADICQALATCGATARMCTAHELAVNAALGYVPTNTSWYSTGMSTTVNSFNSNDCAGWTSSDGAAKGHVWNDQGATSASNCGAANRILCCD